MRLILKALPFAVCALGLAGCVEALPEFKASTGDLRAALINHASTSPRGATVAMASLDGAPDAVTTRFNRAFAKEASAREITTVGPSTAHYLVRGYLNAAAADNGTDVTYVYDIFDANDQQRVDRITDAITVPASVGDPWAAVDDQVTASLAGRSADALASALAETPAAKAALTPSVAATTTP